MATDRVSRPGVGRHRLLRICASVLGLLAIAGVVLSKKGALTRSFVRIGHPRWAWVVVGIVLEALSMTTFALMQSRLLRVGGKRVAARPMLAAILAANSVSASVPVAGPELGAALSFRRFREQGADTTLASWTLVVGGVASWLGALIVLVAGGTLSGHVKIVAGTLLVALLLAVGGLVLWFALRHLRLQKFLRATASSILRPFSRWRSKPVGDPVVAITRWVASLHSLRPTRADWNTIGALSLGNWLTDIGVLAMSILALGGPVPWRSLLLVYGLAMLVGSLGLTPGGLGLVEGTLCVGLVSAGLPAALALSAVLLYRLVSFWLVLCVGWVVLLCLRLERLPRQISMARRVA
jgi:uncharacterized protein (TIRG00374 family)